MVDDTLDAPRPLTQVRGDMAAAILMTLLDEPEAAAIIADLGPDEIKRIGTAMLEVASASAAEIETALDMFVARGRVASTLGLDAARRVRSVMTTALGDARAAQMLATIVPQGSDSFRNRLRWIEGDRLSALLADEHPQVGALLLASLTPEAAAAALGTLSEDLQCDLVFRAGRMGAVSPAALADLEMVIDRAALAPATGAGIRMGGRAGAAKIVTNMPKPDDRRVLKAIRKRDKELAQAIEDDMFVFDDLAALDAKNMGALLRGVDTAELTLALRGASPAMVEQMLGCLSARAADSIRDEIAEAPPVKRAEVEMAQKAVAATARALAEDGTLNLGGKRDDYV